jgi:hypothetical protein
MYKKNLQSGLCVFGLVCSCFGYSPVFPFADAADNPGSTAIHMSTNVIVAWADGYQDLQYGADVAEEWKTPVKALGPAVGNSFDVVVLGRRGRITLTFAQGITDGSGFDFAVFENSVSDSFLELGWIEVSSDGTNFVRFPNYSYTADPVAAFGSVDPTFVYGFGGKYRQGFGTPFDLAELQLVSDSIQTGSHSFTPAYVSAFTNTYPHLDTSDVHYVRIIDIAGDGLDLDSEGYAIYDPYPTSITAGFDLDAIGVMNQPAPSGLVQTISFDAVPHQQLSFGSTRLSAEADSGLPVSFAVQSGPATMLGNILTFTGTGVVEVVAHQPGDATYAPASPILRSFQVAENIQHIFVEAVPDQIQGSGSVQVNAYASSGLPVKMEVYQGPAAVLIGEDTHLLDLGAVTGAVTLRAFQSGNSSTAPAEDVFVDFQIFAAASSNAPLTLATWAASHSVPSNGLTDSDQDDAVDFQEFVMGSNPNNATDVPHLGIESTVDQYDRPAVELDYQVSRKALGRLRIVGSNDLQEWTNTVPEIVEASSGPDTISLKVQLTTEAPHQYYRLIFEEQ